MRGLTSHDATDPGASCLPPVEAAGRGPATAAADGGELLAHFPEVPRDLRDEPILTEYVKAFGPLLRVAQKPSPCIGSGGDPSSCSTPVS